MQPFVAIMSFLYANAIVTMSAIIAAHDFVPEVNLSLRGVWIGV